MNEKKQPAQGFDFDKSKHRAHTHTSPPNDEANQITGATGRRPLTLGDRSEEEILAEIRARFARAPELDGAEIEVSVQNGRLTLTGNVENRYIRDRVVEIILAIAPAADVENKLRTPGGDAGERPSGLGLGQAPSP